MTFFNDGYNAIKILPTDILIENGKILTIDRNLHDDKAEIVDGKGRLCIPGLINGRSRSIACRLSKGLAEDKRFDQFGNTPIYTRVNPFINIALEVLNEEELMDVISLSIFEAIESGTTMLIEHCTGKEMHAFLNIAEKAGIRSICAPMLSSFNKLPVGNIDGSIDYGSLSDEDALLSWRLVLYGLAKHIPNQNLTTHIVSSNC